MNTPLYVTLEQSAATAETKTKWLGTPFINRAAVRKFLLEYAAKERMHKFTRVSEETLGQVNDLVRAYCQSHVRRFPSKGATL